jgi:D-psicose/D-tagatose/L-ribulose 3-epimerase
MNKLGLHSLVYTADWNPRTADHVFARAAAYGYDLVELLMFDPATTDTALTARVAQQHGVGIVASICGTLTADLSNPDPEIARRGEDLIEVAIGAARDMGATMLGGPTFSAVHRYTQAPSALARDRVVDAYGRLADKATTAGVRVGLEALNRYESNFINTVGQAAAIVREVGSPALFVHADLFHMNIEEGDLATAVEDVADVLGYVHVADSNRGPLGGGNINWPSFFAALARIDYRGPITFESFSPAVLGDDFANLVALWRNPWTDPDEIASGAIGFLRAQLAAGAVAVGV